MSSPPTLVSYLEQQDSLIAEASAALPNQFSTCTYALGPTRQAVYLCLTCTPAGAEPAGVCGACSIACHADHEQLELFPKRAFVCDCPTNAVPNACTLHARQEPVNTGNSYGQNFRGRFCRCSRTYDARTERETMVQCIACEDWFHESCLNLRERPPSREPSPSAPTTSDFSPSASSSTSTPLLLAPPAGSTEPLPENDDEDAAASSTTSEDDGLPPALLPGSAYDALICGPCARRIPPLRTCAGTSGAFVVVRDAPSAPWRAVGEKDGEADEEVDVISGGGSLGQNTLVAEADGNDIAAGVKRARSPDAALPETAAPPKRARGDSIAAPSSFTAAPVVPTATYACVMPAPNPLVQALFARLDQDATASESDGGAPEGAGDVFLTEGWRERWCRCPSCLPALMLRPYLLEEEETYEPPADPDSGLSLEELGMRALERLPRDKAIDGLLAFRDMRDDLIEYLRPFAAQGRVVQAADVTTFFDDRREAMHAEAARRAS